MLLARLAVDRTWHGKGLGAGLLKDAITRVLTAAKGFIRSQSHHAIRCVRCFDHPDAMGIRRSPGGRISGGRDYLLLTARDEDICRKPTRAAQEC